MHATCPDCGAQGHISAFFAEVEGKRLANAIFGLQPDLVRALFGYLSLFKPNRGTVRMSAATRIIGEVAAMVSQGEVHDAEGKQRRAASAPQWAAGMDQLLSRRRFLTLPLDSHDELVEAVFRLAVKTQSSGYVPAVEAPASTAAPGAKPEARKSESKLECALNWIAHRRNLGEITAAEAQALQAEARAKHGEQ